MTDATSHLLPQNLEAEEAVIGAMLHGTAAPLEVIAELRMTADHFYRPSHRTLFNLIIELADRGAVDELTVIAELRHRNILGEVGGAAAVTTLYERVPSIANVRAYAEEVIAQSTLRGLVESGHAIAKLGYEHPAAPDELVSDAGRIIDELAERRTAVEQEWTTFGDELAPMLDTLQERRERGDAITGLTTGLEALDQRWGGLQKGRLYIGAGRPGMGKSALLSGICEHIALERGEHVALFNFEMNPEQQAKRGVARHSNADLHRMTSGLPTDEDLEAVSAASVRLFERARNLHINRNAFLTIAQIRRTTLRLHRRLKRTTGHGLAAVGLDYLQLVETPGKRRDNRTNDVSDISRGLKSLALELEAPVFALSQLNRSVETRQPPRPNLSDLRDSGAIEQDADVVLFLYRPEYYLKDETPVEFQGKAEAITAKWRDGTPGTDWIGWDGPRTKFVHARDGQRQPFVAGTRGGNIQ